MPLQIPQIPEKIPEIKPFREADTLGLDDPATAYIAYNDKYIIVFDFSSLGWSSGLILINIADKT